MTSCKFAVTTIHNPETHLCLQVLLACERGKFEQFEEYLENNKGLNIDEQDSTGSTALHFAVAQNNVRCVEILLKHHANPNIQDENGCPPLTLATGRYACPAVAELLIRSGVNVNSRNKWNNTPLHAAVHAQNIHCVEILMNHHADTSIRNNFDETAINLAEVGDIDILDLMRSVTCYVCDNCGKHPKSGLKTCQGCKKMKYCNRDCQRSAWRHGHRQLCSGYVYTSFGMAACGHKNLLHLFKKKFIVKVQVPITIGSVTGENKDILVYDKDRTFLLPISPVNQEKGCEKLIDKIKADGYFGLKAFFWAEIDHRSNKVKVFYNEMAQFQDW